MNLVTEHGKAFHTVMIRHRERFPVLNREAIADMRKIAGIVKKVRQEVWGNQVSMAHAMGIGQSYLSDLERGNRHWSDELIQKWDAALASKSRSRP